MPPQIDDPVLKIFAGGAFLFSLATCLVLLALAWFRGSLLPFAPRRPVPWNAVGTVLAGMMVFTAIATGISDLISASPEVAPVAQPAPIPEVESSNTPADWSSTAAHLILGTTQELILVGGVLAFAAIYFRASRPDLGLPANASEFAHDVLIGSVVGVAALAPIRLIQGMLLILWGSPEMESGHPLVKMLTDGKPSVIVMLVASFAAVVVAPICEEISFRLLLQGWLEKWEAVRLGIWAERNPKQEITNQDVAVPFAELTNDEIRLTDVDAAIEEKQSSIVNHQSSIDSPPALGYLGMPYGWFPIIVTSVLFGLAHFGYGPEPLPLFVLALMLGYTYQRTHRIVPSIVAHAIFNAFTMIALWRIVFHAS